MTTVLFPPKSSLQADQEALISSSDEETAQESGQSNSWIVLPSLFASIGLIIALHMHARSVPLNYFLLASFTIVQALTLSAIVTMYQVAAVVEATILTLVICCGLFLYTLQTKRDFKKGHALGFSLLSILIMATLMQLVFVSSAFHFVVNLAGAALFCFFIIIDLDMLMTELEAEDYILACITLYLDIINLFINLLQLLGEANRG